MNVLKVKTRRVNPPKDNLKKYLEKSLPPLKEGSIICISSKVVSICEGRCVSMQTIDREALVKAEMDARLDNKQSITLTLKNDTIIEWAGIDLSNGDGYFILLPKNPYRSARKIWKMTKQICGVKKVGIIITDSHSVPMRQGATGIALASFGFMPVRKEPMKDVFGNKTEPRKAADIADELAAAGDFVMGDGNESTPIAILSDLDDVRFYVRPISVKRARSYLYISPKFDVYSDLLKSIGR